MDIHIKPAEKETQHEWMGRCMRNRDIEKLAEKIKKKMGLNKNIYDVKLGLCGTLWGEKKISKAMQDAIPKPPD